MFTVLNWKNAFHILSPYFSQNNFRIISNSGSPKWGLSDSPFRELHTSPMGSKYPAYLLFVDLIIILIISDVAEILKLDIIQLFPAKTSRYLNIFTECIILKCTWKPTLNVCDLASYD